MTEPFFCVNEVALPKRLVNRNIIVTDLVNKYTLTQEEDRTQRTTVNKAIERNSELIPRSLLRGMSERIKNG